MVLGKEKEEKFFGGCDFIVELGEDRKNSEINILQLTDMQIIDAGQRRYPDRLNKYEIKAWARENAEVNCYSHIKNLVAQSNPDLIFITGDIVYGSFDDSGEVLGEFIDLMDSFEIPWVICFGNHDNESQIGIDKQCEMYKNGKYCLFKRGSVTGNSNYSVGISVGGELKRVIYLLDTHGCLRKHALLPDQLEDMRENALKIKQACGDVPSFMATHIPVDTFWKAEHEKGYATEEKPFYNLGVDIKAKDGDFGFSFEGKNIEEYVKTEDNFLDLLKECNIDGIFTGHHHIKSTCIDYKGIKLVFGLKTGLYDYHSNGQVGGTLIALKEENKFKVQHLPALVSLAATPSYIALYNKFLSE